MDLCDGGLSYFERRTCLNLIDDMHCECDNLYTASEQYGTENERSEFSLLLHFFDEGDHDRLALAAKDFVI